MRLASLFLVSATLLLGACFGGGDDSPSPSPTPTPVATNAATGTPSATPSAVATASATATVTSTPEPTATATASPASDAGAAGATCTNDGTRAATIAGLRPGDSAFADDLANVRSDHSIDATRVGQVQGATIAVRIIDGPWCNESFNWWHVEADDVALADADGAIDAATRGSVSGWIAEVDQFGLTNLSPDPAALGTRPAE